MHILFHCESVYQVLVACRVKMKVYPEDTADVILSSSIRNYDAVAQNAKESGLFKEVFTQKIETIQLPKWKKVFHFAITPKDLALPNLGKYDRYLICVPNMGKGILLQLLKRKNKRLELYFYEDGLSSYSRLYEKLILEKPGKKGLRAFLLHENKLFFTGLKGIFLFEPRYCVWTRNYAIALPKVTKEDREYIQTVNKIFGYEKAEANLNCKVIFFEESYLTDGNDVDDMPIIRKLIADYGLENVLIKHHPRADFSRLDSLNLQIMPNGHIPWEIYIMNNYEQLKDKLLVSIASGCIFSPYVMFDMEFHCMACFHLFDKKDLYTDIYEVYTTIAKEKNMPLFSL